MYTHTNAAFLVVSSIVYGFSTLVGVVAGRASICFGVVAGRMLHCGSLQKKSHYYIIIQHNLSLRRRLSVFYFAYTYKSL